MKLRQVTAIPQGEEIQLEKARAVVIYNGDMSGLEKELGQLQREHTKRFPNSEEKFSAVVTIAPLYDGMEEERVMRTRKLKDEKGNVLKNPDGTEQTEEYESKRRFIDTTPILLSAKGYAIEENRPFKVVMSLFDTPAKSVASTASGESNNESEGDSEGEDSDKEETE